MTPRIITGKNLPPLAWLHHHPHDPHLINHPPTWKPPTNTRLDKPSGGLWLAPTTPHTYSTDYTTPARPNTS